MFSYLIRNGETRENLMLVNSDWDINTNAVEFWEEMAVKQYELFYYPQLYVEKISFSYLSELISSSK